MYKTTALLTAAVILSGCSIKQTVTPAELAADLPAEICAIPAEGLREGFNTTYKSLLQSKGFTVRELKPNTSPRTCELSTTYIGKWGWDLALYMKYADIRVFNKGRQVGQALYDSRSGGGRLDKFIDAETKIAELTDQLFPNGAAGLGRNAMPVLREDGSPTKAQQLYDLRQQNLSYEQFQSRYQEIMTQP
ncbi:Sbal_3080 family lipoprotein [Stutzerimonas azotifigens]|uniref:Lipoprotein n=1 Tax=Stutzerimonas azotifigens TaxID=291995 RepID=A0ABR5YX43_9GAMM|nr:Sbal_3080 family lipoprotein [Stutzerimonas azotifigens]MBA1272492.1 hypothetical protein [Stutzerimonas azotifigens]